MQSSRKIIFIAEILLSMAAPATAGAATIISANNPMTANTEWTADQSPYIITDDFTIPYGMTLTIDPGVVVKFSGGHFFTVNGRLVANGTPENKIYFTDAADDSVGGVTSDSTDFFPGGYWGFMGNGSSQTFISNAELRALVYDITLAGHGIGLSASFDHVLIIGDHPTIYGDFVDLSISHTDISTYDGGGYAMIFGFRANVNMDDVSIHDFDQGIASISSVISASRLNFSQILGYAFYLDRASFSLSDSTFSNLSPGIGVGAIDISDGASGTISSTTISNVYGDGVHVSTFASVTFASSTLNDISNYGVYSDGATIVSAKNNFWGDASGPYHSVKNPSGLGAAVSDNVDFTPWLGSDPFAPPAPPLSPPPATSTPVIVIPGIFGSEEKNGVWIMDPILHVYDDLVATLAANGYSTSSASTTLFTFPYDWKNSNVYTATLLKQKIADVKTVCHCSKVNLVAHSMGGLVARQYVQSDDYQNDVDKVIFLGTPHLGAPEDYLAWEGAEASPFPINPSAIVMNIVLKEYAIHQGYINSFNFIHDKVPSIQELLPISAYKFDFNSGITQEYSSSTYPTNSFLENLESNKNILNNRVQVFNIVGNIASSTIEKLGVVDSPESSPLYEHGKLANNISGKGIIYGNGDGTVPLSSASDLPIYDTLSNIKHTDLPNYAEEDVFKILTGEDLQNSIRDFIAPDFRFLVINIFSPVHVLVTAPDGKRIGFDSATGQEINEIDGAFYSGTTTENEYVTIPNPIDGHYDVKTYGTASGEYKVTVSTISNNIVTDTSVTGTTSPGTESLQTFTVSSSTVLEINTSTSTASDEPLTTPQAQSKASIPGRGSGGGGGGNRIAPIIKPKSVVQVVQAIPKPKTLNPKSVAVAKPKPKVVPKTQAAVIYQAVQKNTVQTAFGWIGSKFTSIIKGIGSLFNFR